MNDFENLKIGDRVRIHWLDHKPGTSTIVTITSLLVDGSYAIDCGECKKESCWHRIIVENILEVV